MKVPEIEVPVHCGCDCSERVVKALRAELARISTLHNSFTGWQAVEHSLKRIVADLEREAE